jgi:hypothetical protein
VVGRQDPENFPLPAAPDTVEQKLNRDDLTMYLD